MIFDIIIYFAIFAGICASAPIWMLLIYGGLRLFPKVRRIMDEQGDEGHPAAA